jgi:hypothetical protein
MAEIGGKKEVKVMFPVTFPPHPAVYSNVSLVNTVMEGEIHLEFGFLDSLTAHAHKDKEDGVPVIQVARLIMPVSSAIVLHKQLGERLGGAEKK